jgi:hypothetical protein
MYFTFNKGCVCNFQVESATDSISLRQTEIETNSAVREELSRLPIHAKAWVFGCESHEKRRLLG